MLLVNPLHETPYALPVLESIHLIGVFAGVGAAVATCLRVATWKKTVWWTIGGLFVAIFSGLAIFSIDAERYLGYPIFRAKLTLLLVVLLFHFLLVRTRESRLIGWVGLALWLAVPLAGVLLGYAESLYSLAAYAYPTALWLHIAAMLGMAAMFLAGASTRAKHACLGVGLLTGLGMVAAKPAMYSFEANPWFWGKLAFVVAIALAARIPRIAVVAAWVGVIAASRGPATIKDIMQSMVDPTGDFLFQSVQTVSNDQGVAEKAPQTSQEWAEVREHLQILINAPDALLADDRRAGRPRDRSKSPEVENEPQQVLALIAADRAGFERRAKRLATTASIAMKAVEGRDKSALVPALDAIDKACESCHLHYWYPNDKRAQEAAITDGITD